MTKQELWEAVCVRYPDFRDEEHVVRQRARGLRRLLDQAWDEGHEKGVANGKALEAMRRDAEVKKNPLAGLFP
ncbi:MAG: hypothetical protein WC718_00085 [Phycisphaerales bacterium]|jgi:hypothetical protein